MHNVINFKINFKVVHSIQEVIFFFGKLKKSYFNAGNKKSYF